MYFRIMYQIIKYFSLAIIYAVYTMANWISPSVVALLGPRVTMLVGALAYAGFIAQLLILNTVLLYVMSAVLGVGAAILWTAQVFIFFYSWISRY